MGRQAGIVTGQLQGEFLNATPAEREAQDSYLKRFEDDFSGDLNSKFEFVSGFGIRISDFPPVSLFVPCAGRTFWRLPLEAVFSYQSFTRLFSSSTIAFVSMARSKLLTSS